MPVDPPIEPAVARRFGERLKQLRQARGYTQESLAHAAGINRNHYQLIESGISDRKKNSPANPRLSTLIRISQVLQTSVPDLVIDLFPEDEDTTAVEYEPLPPYRGTDRGGRIRRGGTLGATNDGDRVLGRDTSRRYINPTDAGAADGQRPEQRPQP